MTQHSLERKVNILEKKIASLEKEIYDLHAVKEINDLMAKYEYFHSGGMFPEHAELFAKRDDTTAQLGPWGSYIGWESIRKLFAGFHYPMYAPGCFFEHSLTTPMVIVAGDGRTAKGVWISPGHETQIDEKTGKPQPAWIWVKYACDFIRMPDERWYIWHLFVLISFITNYEKSWADGGELGDHDPTSFLPPELQPDAPGAPFHDPYDPKKRREFLPAFPLPYDTYDEKEGINWIFPHAIRRKPYPHDLENTKNIWPNGGWK